MAKYERFEDLPVWQEAARLYNAVLDLLEEVNCPLTWGFRNQLDRAALSVSNNIAEGFERASTKELVGYLGIARGSAGEVRSMIAAVKNRRRLIELKQHFGVIVHLANPVRGRLRPGSLQSRARQSKGSDTGPKPEYKTRSQTRENRPARSNTAAQTPSAIGYLLLAMVLL